MSGAGNQLDYCGYAGGRDVVLICCHQCLLQYGAQKLSDRGCGHSGDRIFASHILWFCGDGIEISNWLYLTIIAFAFYFGLGKRRNELAGSGSSETRKVLQYYNHNFLDKNMYLCVALGIMFYSLWTIEHTSEYLVWSVPMVLVICMKYSLDIEGRSDGDPVEVLVHDKVLVIMCLVYGLMVLGMLYL